MGHLFRVLWILPESINPILCSLSKDMFHIPSLWEQCLEIYTRVHARNTESSREGVTLLPCAGHHWRHKHRDTPRTFNSSGLKNCNGQQGGCSLVSGWLFLVLPSWHKKCYSYPPQKARVLFLQQLSVAGSLRLYGALTRLGIQMPPAHPGLCTQVCPLPKNIMPKRDIFLRRTGIPRTHGWQYQPCILDGDISASFRWK